MLHYCGQTAGWMKTPLGTEVDIGAGHIALDGFPPLRERGTAPPLLVPCLLWPRSPISVAAELLLYKNRLRVAKVVVKNKRRRFLWFTVYNNCPNTDTHIQYTGPIA